VYLLTKLAEGQCAFSMPGRRQGARFPGLRYRGLFIGDPDTYLITDVGRSFFSIIDADTATGMPPSWIARN
jgi:hypothetical protein